MHVQTHLMSGWCVADWFEFTPRERFCCMLAASLADLDGLGIFFGREAYWNYHHKLGHNLPFALLLSLTLTGVAVHRIKAFLVFVALAHLHLLLDYFGSGPGWPIYYLWPFSQRVLENPRAWEFYSWQNMLTALVFFIWLVIIAIRRGRTPLEWPMPRLDAQLVVWLRRRFKSPDVQRNAASLK